MVKSCRNVEYDLSIMTFSSSEGMTEVGMNSERMACDSSAKEYFAQAVCQSEGRVGMWVGM